MVAEMPVAQEAHFREGDEDGPSGCCLLGEGVDDRQVRRDVVGHRLELDGGDSLEDGGAFLSMGLSRFVWLAR